MAEDWEALRARLAQHGQDHLLRFLPDMSAADKGQLFADIANVDLAKLGRCFERARGAMETGEAVKDELLQPLDEGICGSTARNREEARAWEKRGLEMVSQGKVAVLLLAGGQGTRLGVPYPKGMYDVGLPSGKTLYQLQAERLLRLQQLAQENGGTDCLIPWYIMTSEHTKEPTQEYFERHAHFGLKPSNFIIFEQNTLPCLDFEGQILMSERHRLARAPDGNGGLYAALRGEVLEDMERRGVACVHVYCVDNILVKMADPVFVGFCDAKGAECGAKVTRKHSPTEQVGVVCRCDGKYQVVEYSEISINIAEQRNADGCLTFNAGNICNHFFTVPFLKRVCSRHEDELVHHIARKRIPYVNNAGEKITPSRPNGIKMEKFVFDVFQFAKSFAVLEVIREDEFSPLKNAPGASKNTPATARAALLDLHYRQVLEAGGAILDSEGRKLPLIPRRVSVFRTNGDSRASPDNGTVTCEVSPLVSYFGEGLMELVKGKSFSNPLLLEARDLLPSPVKRKVE